MPEGINLAEKQTTTNKKSNPFALASLVVVGIIILVAGVLFAYTLFLKSTLSYLITQEDQQIQKLTALTPEKTKILTIQERLSAIQRILTNRQNMSTNFQAIAQTIPGGIQISDIASTEKGITIKVASTSLDLLNAFLEEKLPEILKDKAVKVKKIDIANFSFQRGSAGYSTTVAFAFL